MSLFNRDFLAFDGNPITGRQPTQILVYAEPGVMLTPEQQARTEHAYKLFCDAVKTSANAGGYHIQNRQLPDGTRVRMESNSGMDRVMVWPVASEDEEVLFLGSPRVVFAGGTLHDGYANEEVALYSIRNAEPMRLRRLNVFKEKNGLSALNQQPGNALWRDTRTVGKKTKRVLSWWNTVQRNNNYTRPDTLIPDSVFWNRTTDCNRLYIDGEFLVKFAHPVYGAGLFIDENGVEHIRVALVTQTQRKAIVTFQFKLSDVGDESKWLENYGGANYGVSSPCAFNDAATAFCCIETNNVTYDAVVSTAGQVVEYAFESMTKTVVFTGTRVVQGQPSVPTPTNSISGATNETDFGMSSPISGADYFGGTGDAVPAYGTYDNIRAGTDFDSQVDTYSASWTRTGTRSGAVTTTYTYPVVCGYKEGVVAYVTYKRIKVAEANESRTDTCTVSATVTKDGGRTEYYYTSPFVLVATVYGGRTTTTDCSSTLTEEYSVSILHTEQIIITSSTIEEPLYDSGVNILTNGSRTYSATAAASSPTAGVPVYYGREQYYTGFTSEISVQLWPYSGDPLYTNDGTSVSQWESDSTIRKSVWVDVFAADFSRDYVGLVIAEFSPAVVVEDGRIAEKLTLKEYLNGKEVFSLEKLTAPADPDSFYPPAEEYTHTSAPSMHIAPAFPLYKIAHYTGVRYAPDGGPSSFDTYWYFTLHNTGCPPEGTEGYNGYLDAATLFVSSNIMPIKSKRLKYPLFVSGLLVNYSLYCFGESISLSTPPSTSTYTGGQWALGGFGPGTATNERLANEPSYGTGIAHHILDTGKVIDDAPALIKPLPEGTGDTKAWLSSPIYLPEWKIPK